MEWIPVAIVAVAIIYLKYFANVAATLHYRQRGPLFTGAERSFYGVLCQAAPEHTVVMAKVRVADILTPEPSRDKSLWQSAFNKVAMKHFDFVVCDQQSMQVLAAVELDDKSHSTNKAKQRDTFINDACEDAGLRLVRFPAKKGYQIDVVRETLSSALDKSNGSS